MNGLYRVSLREEVQDYLRPLAQYFIELEGGERGRAGDVLEMFLQIGIQPITFNPEDYCNPQLPKGRRAALKDQTDNSVDRTIPAEAKSMSLFSWDERM